MVAGGTAFTCTTEENCVLVCLAACQPLTVLYVILCFLYFLYPLCSLLRRASRPIHDMAYCLAGTIDRQPLLGRPR